MNELLRDLPGQGVVIYHVSAEIILSLRHRVLRPGLPPETARFPGDERDATWHVAAFPPGPHGDEGPVISCASFFDCPYRESNGWQLRGMCTDPSYRGFGISRILLEVAAQTIVADSGVRLFWCNARMLAIGFYQKQGWKVDSEEFDIPTAGLHKKMYKRY
ncbi:MAG: GNAT family N-acetyltransferase [Patescibacteria group bacterium]|nr:GNAT family N-acetyltransferase [Patescibacteria group bacterium]